MNISNASKINDTLFPQFVLTMQVLCACTPHHIGRWSKDGTQFDVLSAELFHKVVQIHFPRIGKPASFQRQLSNYGWTRIKSTKKERWSFRHPYFYKNASCAQLGQIKLVRLYPVRMDANLSDLDAQDLEWLCSSDHSLSDEDITSIWEYV